MATDALVSGVVQHLYSIATDELSSPFGVDKEVDELSSTFSALQAVLEDAERHQVKNEHVRNWLWQLRQVTYEVEDILDEWVTDVSISQEEKDETHQSKKARFTFDPLTQFWKKVKLHYDIGKRIREATERLEKISSRKKHFNLKELNAREEMLVPNKEERQTGSLIDESEIFGRDDFKKRIIEQLVSETSHEEKSVSIVAIVGMGGLGKTTLAQLVYNDQTVMTHFEKRSWVCVSEPFDLKMIAEKIIESMGGDGSTSKNPDLDTLQRNLRQATDKKRFLLVLDDVWDENGTLWDKVRISFMGAAPGSKVVVTTRSRQVAEAMETTLIHELSILSYSDSWKLFKSKALNGTEAEESRELIEVGEKIVERCKGVPLAVRALGSLLRRRRTKSYWEHILKNDIWKWNVDKKDGKDGILPALLLSYYSLPPHLQRCFSFCSVFPKDWWLMKDELVKLWMANGIIKCEKAENDDMEETGEMYFDDLLTRSLFQDAEKDNDGNIVKCKMHDLVHDLATFVSSGDYCSMEADEPKLSFKCHHLSLHVTWGMSSMPSLQCNVERLRTLLLCGYSNIEVVPDSLFNPLRFLRALDLSGTSIESLPTFIGKLKHLRYLSLCRLKIRELPEFVTDLYNLQTLQLNDCNDLDTLPSGMSKMVKLLHLEIERTCRLTVLPNGLGRLSTLRTLSRFPVGIEKEGCKIGELKNLNHLRGELMIENLERVMNVNDAKEAELHKKSSLHVLSLSSEEKSDDEWRTLEKDEMERMEQVLENLRPPHSNLKKLEIVNYAGQKFPNWLEDSAFSSLVRVVLEDCRKCTELPGLGKLHSLKYLEIIGAVEVKVVGSEFYGNVDVKGTIIFPKLEELHFEDMLNWEEWKLIEEHGEVKVMPSLKKLKIFDCNKLKVLPTCLPSSLIKVKIRNCKEVIWAQENPLPHLRYLTLHDVRGISSFKALPSLPVGALKIWGFSRKSLPSDGWGFSCESLPSDGWGRLEPLHPLKICNGPELASLPGTLKISCRGGLSSLLKELGQLKALQTLRISGCGGLSSLPDELGQLKALQTLEISDCEGLSSLPDGIGQLKALRTLTITNCKQLSSLPKELGQLKTLEDLEISNCDGLSSLPDDLGQLKALQSLMISKLQQLSSLPDGIGQLKALRTLTITNCKQLSSLPKELGQLRTLEDLKISNCDGLSSLPDELGQLKALRTLEIFGCKGLSSLPDGIGQLKALRTLTITYCKQLSSLPKELGQLRTLEDLKISNCDGLSSLPDELGQLKALRTLEIFGCKGLSSLPDGIGQLKALRTLTITYCKQLSSLPKELGQLKTLQTLKISNCDGLSSLPDDLGQLKALQTLKISDCEGLSSLPDGIGQLKALRTLIITNCKQLSSLPKELGQLKTLEYLKISGCNGLSSLPGELGQLKALQTLELSDCKRLSSLPECLGLGLLDMLQSISFCGCDQLTSLLKGSGRFKALQRLGIQNCKRLMFLSDGLLQLEALQYLSVVGCSNLQSLFDGFEQLISLRGLSIYDCPQLRPLPNLQRLAALEHLQIRRCPLVTEQLEKEKGEEWCNLSHIPFIVIDDEVLQNKENKNYGYIQENKNYGYIMDFLRTRSHSLFGSSDF